MVTLLSEILPFMQCIQEDSFGILQTTALLWSDNFKPWETVQLRRQLEKESTEKMGYKLNVNDYRHIAIAIDRQHVRGLIPDEDDVDDDSNDEGNPHDYQAGHTTMISEAIYARRVDLLKALTDVSVAQFRTVTDRWHKFCGLESRIQSVIGIRAYKRRHEVQDVDTLLSDFMGSDAMFKSNGQRNGLKAIINRVPVTAIILPTGGGKSLLFMLPATRIMTKTTIVTVPYVSLVQDMLRRCKELKISAMEWKPGPKRFAKIIIVSADRATSTEFRTYCWDLHHQGKLERIIFDECHVLLEVEHFRSYLWRLRMISTPVQFVFLSATLPPNEIEQLKEFMLLSEIKVIREKTSRKEAQFQVCIHADDAIQDTVIEIVQEAQQNIRSNEKIIVFGDSRNRCDQLAEELNCESYHSQSNDRDGILTRFSQGACQVIVATGALGTGIDIRGIQTIIFIGIPFGAISFTQMYGRGARDGGTIDCRLILSEYRWEKLKSVSPGNISRNDRSMREFILTESCRRIPLSEYMDGDGEDCKMLVGELCDNCRTSEANDTMVEYERASVIQMDEAIKVWNIRGIFDLPSFILKGSCEYCSVIEGRLIKTHLVHQCQQLERQWKYKIDRLGRQMVYTPGVVCFACGVPGDYCNGVGMNTMRVCTYGSNWLLALCLGIRMNERLWTVAKTRIGYDVVLEEYLGWLGKPRRVKELNATNGFALVSALLTRLKIRK